MKTNEGKTLQTKAFGWVGVAVLLVLAPLALRLVGLRSLFLHALSVGSGLVVFGLVLGQMARTITTQQVNMEMSERRLAYQREIQTVLAKVASLFFDSSPGLDLAASIDEGLQRIGEFLKVDRGYLYLVNNDDVTIAEVYQWCASGIAAPTNSHDGSIDWWLQYLWDFGAIRLRDVEDLAEQPTVVSEELRHDGVRSLLRIPVRVDNDLAGFLGFDCVEQKRNWSDEDVVLLQLAERVIANALARNRAEQTLSAYAMDLELSSLELEDMNRKLDEEIGKAKRVHERTLPVVVPEFAGLEFFAYYQPADRMGGDFYNFIRHDSGLLFYISDITGHGLDAAMMSAFVKNTIGTYASLMPKGKVPQPVEILRFMASQYRKENYPEDYFISILLGVVDNQGTTITYSSAGMHTAPLLFSDNGVVELPSGNMPISSTIPWNQIEYRSERLSLSAGDVLLFSTDGLIEQRAGEEIFNDSLRQTVGDYRHLPCQVIGEEINKSFRSFSGSAMGDDDITYFVLQVPSSDQGSRLDMVIDSSFAAVATAEEKVGGFLSSYGAECDEALMALHELLINAIEHGHGFDRRRQVSISVEVREFFLRASVEDEGYGHEWLGNKIRTSSDLTRIQDDVADRGRGLGLAVTQMATDYFYFCRGEKGTRTSFVILR